MVHKEEPRQETAAIVRVIENSMAALTHRDFTAYADTWVHAPYARRVGGWSLGTDNSAQGGISVHEGWNDISPLIKRFLEEGCRLAVVDEKPNAVYPYGTQRENWNIRVGGDVAWATFDQYPLDSAGRPAPNTIGFSHETRMLEKHSGKWRLAYVSVFHELPYQTDQALIQVDENAAIMTMSRTAAELIGNSETLRVRNGRLHAVDRNADLRLRAIIKETARANPWTVGAVRVPVVLKTPWGSLDHICWIAPSKGMNASAVIVIGGTAASRRRLHNAVLVYRLSPAQAHLAEKIVEGHDLVAAAEQLGVTANTARTHLHRMFEKTGVHSQPALVGALLSVASPLA